MHDLMNQLLLGPWSKFADEEAIAKPSEVCFNFTTQFYQLQ